MSRRRDMIVQMLCELCEAKLLQGDAMARNRLGDRDAYRARAQAKLDELLNFLYPPRDECEYCNQLDAASASESTDNHLHHTKER